MLATIWFILWGLLWAVYFMLDGFDLGMGILLPFLARNDMEKRIVYNAAGPYWDGNEVWLITAGGVTFAAFPKAYAVMFSALYTPLLLLLFALIFRAVSFEFRNKIDCPRWRGTWDKAQFLGNFLPALLFGVAFANLFSGIPIDQQGVYHGNIFRLLSQYGLMGGCLFVCLFAMHGALWLYLKSTGTLKTRAKITALILWPIVAALAFTFLTETRFATGLYQNFIEQPLLRIFPLLAVCSLLGVLVSILCNLMLAAWIANALFILLSMFSAVFGMYPNLVISSLDPVWSVTIANGASSTRTLFIMLLVALLLVPVVIAYQFWAYKTFAKPVTEDDLKDGHAY